MSDALRQAFGDRKRSDKKRKMDPRQGLEFKRGRPPLGRSDHLGNPVTAISIKKGGILKIDNKWQFTDIILICLLETTIQAPVKQ